MGGQRKKKEEERKEIATARLRSNVTEVKIFGAHFLLVLLIYPSV